MTTKTKVALGLLGAVAAGAVIGLLLAPEKGADLRKRVKNTAGDWASRFSDMLESGKEDLSNLKEKVKNKARSAANGANDRYESVKEDFS